MNSPFVAVTNPPIKGAEASVANDGWWPDVNCEKLREDARLDGTVTPARLLLAVEDAMLSVNRELADWQAAQLELGYASLADVPATQLGGHSVKLKHYLRAIQSHVQSQLASAYRDIDTLPDGAGKESRVRSALEIRQDSLDTRTRHAIADLQGLPRVIAELL